jgi:pyruvate kinase
MRSTKIVATIGPASKDIDVLEQMVAAGMDVARLNFAHGDSEQHAEIAVAIRTAAERAGRDIAILGDLPGPKLRIGPVSGGVAELARDSRVVLTAEPIEGTAERLPVAWEGFAELVDKGDVCYLADGAVRLRQRRDEGRGRRQRRVAPGTQSPERHRLAAGRERGGHRADRRRDRDGRGLLRPLVRAPP